LSAGGADHAIGDSRNHVGLALYNSLIFPYNQAMSNTAINKTNLTRGYSVAVIAAVILSTTAIFIRYLTQNYHLPALVLSLWREVIVALSLLAGLRLLQPALLRVNRQALRYLVLYGLVLAIFNALWTLSVALNGAAVSTVLAYCSAAFTALLGWWLLKERLDWSKLLAVALCLGGCVLVSGALDPAAWRVNLLGIITGVFSGLLYAIYSLMGRSASQRGLNPWTTLLYAFGFASGFLLIFNLLGRGILPGAITRLADFLWLGKVWSGWAILLLLAVGPTLAGYGLNNVSLSLLPSSVANLIDSMEQAFTALIAYLLLGERLTWVQVGGSLLILSGVIFLRVYDGWLAGRSETQPEPAGL
jgi:drug/metabolite transporter (DMT)-like permease